MSSSSTRGKVHDALFRTPAPFRESQTAVRHDVSSSSNSILRITDTATAVLPHATKASESIEHIPAKGTEVTDIPGAVPFTYPTAKHHSPTPDHLGPSRSFKTTHRKTTSSTGKHDHRPTVRPATFSNTKSTPTSTDNPTKLLDSQPTFTTVSKSELKGLHSTVTALIVVLVLLLLGALAFMIWRFVWPLSMSSKDRNRLTRWFCCCCNGADAAKATGSRSGGFFSDAHGDVLMPKQLVETVQNTYQLSSNTNPPPQAPARPPPPGQTGNITIHNQTGNAGAYKPHVEVAESVNIMAPTPSQYSPQQPINGPDPYHESPLYAAFAMQSARP